MNIPFRKTVIFVAACAFAASAAAQHYKWIDKKGKVVYGDTPPAGVKATPLRVPASPSAPAPASDAAAAKAPVTPAQIDADFRKRQQERQEADEKVAKERADAENQRINCQRAQAGLRTLQSGQRVASTNQAGERVYLDDGQRAQEIERTQEAVKEWCK